jgi:hypothetical protein
MLNWCQRRGLWKLVTPPRPGHRAATGREQSRTSTDALRSRFHRQFIDVYDLDSRSVVSRAKSKSPHAPEPLTPIGVFIGATKSATHQSAARLMAFQAKLRERLRMFRYIRIQLQILAVRSGLLLTGQNAWFPFPACITLPIRKLPTF